jgi:MFS family permease
MPIAIFYGWWIVAAGFVIQMLNGVLFLQSFGAYFVHWQTEFGWDRTSLSGAFSMQQMESGILGPIQGWLIQRFGPRTVVRVGVVIAGIGLMLLAKVENLWQFYGAFGLIALGSALGGFLAVFSTLANWFVKQRSRAIGISMAGMSVGGLLIPILAWSLGHYGWRSTAFGSGIVMIVGGIVAAQLLRHAPEPYGYLPDGTSPKSKDAAPDEGTAVDQASSTSEPDVSFTTREAIQTRAFWFLSIAHASALLVVSALMVHLIPHIVERLGYSVEIAGMVVALMTAFVIMSQVFGGALGDKVQKRYVLTLCLIGHSIALLGLAFSSHIWQIALFAVIHGLAWGTRGPIVIAIRADYFGRSSYATIMGFSSIIMMLGMMCGPLLAGTLADRLGDYGLGFTILASIAGLGSVFFLLAKKPDPPPRLMRR